MLTRRHIPRCATFLVLAAACGPSDDADPARAKIPRTDAGSVQGATTSDGGALDAASGAEAGGADAAIVASDAGADAHEASAPPPPPPVGLPAGVTLQPIDGGPDYFGANGFTYAKNAGWDDPAFFSIGVWYGMILDQADVNRWKDLGLNTSFVTTGNTDLALLRANGIWAIENPGESPNMGSETVGLLTTDEGGVNDIKNKIAGTANSTQDNRYWYMNLTWNFIEYGDLSQVAAPTLLSMPFSTPNASTRRIDVQSVDIYWFAGSTPGSLNLYAGGLIYDLGRDMTADETRRGCRYGDMVDRIRAYQTAHPAPIAQIIENGGPYVEDTTAATYMTPPNLNWSVWSSIIHGARQIDYFNHSFAGPAQSNDNLRETYYKTVQAGQTTSIYAQVKATNALIKQLAPVINSPTALGYVTAAPAPAPLSGIETMAKYSDGQFYIFADTRESETATNVNATFTIKSTGATSVTVVNENRSLPIANGTTFTDTFAKGSTVHIYKVN